VKREVSPGAFSAATEEVRQKIAASKLPSYETITVTAKAKGSSDKLPFAEDSDRGMIRGRIVHRILEAASRDGKADIELMAENLLKEEARGRWEKDSVIATVRGVMPSELWSRMKGAEMTMIEIPFSARSSDDTLPRVISGATRFDSFPGRMVF
jgi:hypothetical protein